MIRRSLLAVAMVAVCAGAAEAQSGASVPPGSDYVGGRHSEEGRPFIRTYAPLDVIAAGQNWAIVQDPRGGVLRAS